MKLGKEVKIGITGIIALGILIFGINYLKGINLFKSSSFFYVKFENVNGLPKSSPVIADGVRIGTVRDIIYDYKQPRNVVVEISVSPELRVPKGSYAELSSDFLGNVSLELLLANNPREKVAAGDTIHGYVNGGALGEAAKMVPQIQQMLPKLDSILYSLNKLLADESLPSTLKNVETMTSSLARTSQSLEALMRKDIPSLTHKMDTIAGNFVTISNQLKGIDYIAAMQKIDATLENVRLMTEKMQSKEGSIGLLLNDTQLYENLTLTTKNAATLLEDLQAHPKRYVHFSLFGKKNR